MASSRRYSLDFILLLLGLISHASIPAHASEADCRADEMGAFKSRRSAAMRRSLEEVVSHRHGLLQEGTKNGSEIADPEIANDSHEKTASSSEGSFSDKNILAPERKEEKLSGEQKNATAVTQEKVTTEYEKALLAVQDLEPYVLGPTIKDWDEQRETWLKKNPHMRKTRSGKPPVLIVSGSQPKPCSGVHGDFVYLRSLKLKSDYARMHGHKIYYSFAFLDPSMDGFWAKLPVVRKLMLTHPEIEWLMWVDADAVFTDMLFEIPFEDYEGRNMVMWGWEKGLFELKSSVSFNDGVFLLRNCQWSLDLIDKWSPMGHQDVRIPYGKLLSAFLTGRGPDDPSDDQSALAYLILTDEAVKDGVKFVDEESYMMSAWWVKVVGTYEESMEKYHPGLGNQKWPWVTHFTGCSPCKLRDDRSAVDQCMNNFTRAFNFADNQVLAYLGFRHESLSSATLVRTRKETDQPLQFVGVNPWEERIAQVAAMSSKQQS